MSLNRKSSRFVNEGNGNLAKRVIFGAAFFGLFGPPLISVCLELYSDVPLGRVPLLYAAVMTYFVGLIPAAIVGAVAGAVATRLQPSWRDVSATVVSLAICLWYLMNVV